VHLDWSRIRAVVLESDDWGLCAWAPDEPALRALLALPQFRSPAGRRYAGSTLESANDVRRLAARLAEFKGGDGFPPVWQANTVMAAPDYARLAPPDYACDALPLADFPEAPGRWARPGLGAAVRDACAAGTWWPELHGLHHLPEAAWLRALRDGADDARRAFEQQSPVCDAVAASGEYDPSEPLELRRRNLGGAVRRFRSVFGRAPESFCPPDYRWDDAVEAEAERLGVTTIQGRAERADGALPRVRHFLGRFGFPRTDGARFYLPARIAFEPGAEDEPRLGADAAHRAIHAAWKRSQPAIVSTHRASYVQLDPGRGAAALDRLAGLLARLCEERATFLTDSEVRGLATCGVSERPIGSRGTLARHAGDAGELGTEWRAV